VLQQVSCYCKNLDSLRGLRGVLSIADAMAQTRWALGFEYPLYRAYQRRVERQRLRPLIYCVGHGCFVAHRFLQRIGGFPTISPNDDLSLGYLASTLGVAAAPLSTLDYCDVAPDPIASISQSRFWYAGSARFQRDIDHYQRAFQAPLRPLQRMVLYVDGHMRNLMWAWRGMLMIAALALALLSGNVVLVAGLIACHLWYVQGGFMQTYLQLRWLLPGAAESSGLTKIPLARMLAATGLTSVTFFMRSFGPLAASLALAPRAEAHAQKIER
jgi:hypothetical protein